MVLGKAGLMIDEKETAYPSALKHKSNACSTKTQQMAKTTTTVWNDKKIFRHKEDEIKATI